MWRNKTPQRAESSTGVLCSLAAFRWRTYTILLGEGCASSIIFLILFVPLTTAPVHGRTGAWDNAVLFFLNNL